jgi:glycogen synthase
MKSAGVLMLGWEYPPIINGGLGVACKGISTALAETIPVTMILPISGLNFKREKLNVIGSTSLTSNETCPGNKNKKDSVQLNFIPIDFDPYFKTTPSPITTDSTSESFRLNSSAHSSLYDTDMITKVNQFADHALSLSRKMKFDLIHVHDWMTMPAGLRIRNETGKPLVIHIHSLETDRSGAMAGDWVYELEKRCMEQADLLIAVSNYTSDKISRNYGISPEKIRIVHNGITAVESFRTIKQMNEKIVLFVGRVTWQKGPAIFLQIAEKVLSVRNDVRFVIAGAGDSLQRLIERTAQHSFGNKIHFTGFLNEQELRKLFSLSDVYCMPSVSEPFGLSAVEAAQFQVPCVLSKQSGVREVLSSSFQFDFWDVDRASAQILGLLNYPVLRKKMVEDAAAEIRSVNWKISADRILHAYRSLKLM